MLLILPRNVLASDFEEQGAKQHKEGENAQPLTDHWVNFSSLVFWLVSFVQILIYYDNCWRLSLKQFFR